MPRERIVTEDQYQKEEDDFDSVFNDIVDKTDEELSESGDDEAKPTDEQTGESTEDSSAEAKKSDDKEDPIPEANSDQGKEPDTGAGVNQEDWKSRAEKAEAELQKERQRTSSWDGRINAANKKAKALEEEVKSLREKLDKKMESQQTEEELSDQEVMSQFKETFPELVEVVDILQKKIDKTSAIKAKAKDPEPADSTYDHDPEPASSDDSAAGAQVAPDHLSQVRAVHKDMDEAVASGQILTWINNQPEYQQGALNDVYYGRNGMGTTKQVIDLLSDFKKQTGWKSGLLKNEATKQDKLKSMLESEGPGDGPVDRTPPDKNDYAAAAKEAGL